MKKIGNDYPKFEIGDGLNEEHIRFFQDYGFIHFRNFLSREELDNMLGGLHRLQEKWLGEGTRMVNGIPLKFGKDHNGNPIIQRFAFTSLYCNEISDFVTSERISQFVRLLDTPSGRVGVGEKDGVVVNQYINTGQSKLKQMGWHTDGLRDIFYGQKVLPMLNVGINFTDSKTPTQGGLRLIPGTHKQTVFGQLLRKKHFLSTKRDRNEVSVEADRGDLTIHHGNVWHRVEMAPIVGPESHRITMYIPIICGKYKPKHERSATPFYHRLKFLAKK